MGDLIRCRATINLPRARHGAVVLVDPSAPDIRTLIEAELLIPEGNVEIPPLSGSPVAPAGPEALPAGDLPPTPAPQAREAETGS